MTTDPHLIVCEQLNTLIISDTSWLEKVKGVAKYIQDILNPEYIYIHPIDSEKYIASFHEPLILLKLGVPQQISPLIENIALSAPLIQIKSFQVDNNTGLIFPIVYKDIIIGCIVALNCKTNQPPECNLTQLAIILNLIMQLEHCQNHETELEKISAVIWNSMNEAVFISSFDGRIIEVNHEACKLTEYSRNELTVMLITELEISNTEDDVQKQLNLVQQSEQLIFGTALRTKSGKIVPLTARSFITEYKEQEVFLSFIKTNDQQLAKDSKILATIIETEKKERNRFAKDLHDGIGPLLSCIKMYIEDLVDPETETVEKEEIAITTIDMIDDAILSIRRVADNLMPTILKEYGLEKAIASFCKKVNLPGKTIFNFTHNLHNERLASNIEFEIYQIVQELINNTLKHAGATRADIDMQLVSNVLEIHYSDNGRGFDVPQILSDTIGTGISNIKQRVELLNGTFVLSSEPNKGIKIEILLSKLNMV